MRWNWWLTAAFALLVVGAALLVADNGVFGVILVVTGASLLIMVQQANRRDPYPDRGAARGTSPTGERGRSTRAGI